VKQPTRDELFAAIKRGDIDTVVMAFPDLQGRLVGKRTTGRFFLEQVAEHGTENCDYLIATDFDDVAVPGYRFASYDLGYGDMLARADFATIRITPWVPKTALVLCDLFSVKTGEPIRVAPRQVLRDQVIAAQRMNLEPMIGSEIEFYLFRDSYEEIYARGHRDLTPHSPFMEDYQIAQTTRDEYVVGGFPFVDLSSGGSVEGLIENHERLVAQLPDDIKIIPGHGPLSTKAEMQAWIGMVKTTAGLVMEQVVKGRSLEQIKAEGLPPEYAPYGTGFINEAAWIDAIYRSSVNP